MPETPTNPAEEQPTTSINQATRMVEDILRWKTEIPDAHATLLGLHSPQIDSDPTGGNTADRLPFGLDAVTDTANEDGPLGIRTHTGVSIILTSLATWAAGLLNTTVKGDPGAWLLRQLQDNPNWITRDPDEWDEWTHDLKTTWAVVRRITGHQPQRIAPCPQCGHTLKAEMTTKGRAETATCGCGLTITTTAAGEYEQQLIQLLRSPTISQQATVTRDELRSIWPGLRSDKLRKWVSRNRVSRDGDYYQLATVNTCMTVRT